MYIIQLMCFVNLGTKASLGNGHVYRRTESAYNQRQTNEAAAQRKTQKIGPTVRERKRDRGRD